MRKYIYIGIGGALGATIRYSLKVSPVLNSEEIHSNSLIINYILSLPLYTLIANISGCFLLAAVLSAFAEIPEFDPDVKPGITVGFLGAYTTLSTLCKETLELFYSGSFLHAVLYLLISILPGLAAAWAGSAAGSRTGAKLFSR